MALDPQIAKAIDAAVDRDSTALTDLARNIHRNPELRFQEHKAAAWIAELVRARGYAVETGAGGLPTALLARAGKQGGPRVAILAEYDALPEIGHACGHNLIAAGGVGAYLAAAEVAEELGGPPLHFRRKTP